MKFEAYYKKYGIDSKCKLSEMHLLVTDTFSMTSELQQEHRK